MTDTLREKYARTIAFAGRHENDQARDADHYWSCLSSENRARHLQQADAIMAEVGRVRVKPLEWRGLDYSYAETVLGRYGVDEDEDDGGWLVVNSPPNSPQQVSFQTYETEEAAKAACQRDYESRILSCLEGTQP